MKAVSLWNRSVDVNFFYKTKLFYGFLTDFFSPCVRTIKTFVLKKSAELQTGISVNVELYGSKSGYIR